MIVQCPECATNFRVADELLKPDGRKVRCAMCKHEWYQEYIEQQQPHDEDENADGVSADHDSFLSQMQALDDDNVDKAAPNVKQQSPLNAKPSLLRRLLNKLRRKADAAHSAYEEAERKMNRRGFIQFISILLGVIFCYFVVISGFIGLKDHLTLRFPSLYNVYSFLGYQITPAGQNLLLKDTQAVWKHDKNGMPHLVVQGAVYNSAEETRRIPPIKITLLLKSGAKGDSYLFELDPAIIDGGATQKFTIDMAQWPETANDILVAFDVDGLN